MPEPVIIALDAMGGDHGPEVVIPGADIALSRRPDTHFKLFGDEAAISPILKAHPRVAAACEVVHTDIVVRMDDKPSQALRRGRRRSSMWLALEAVKNGEAHVAVSAGNTGALMAMARFSLRTLAGIDRPAIAAIWPTLRGESIVLDVGATIGADAQQLVDCALMGEAMARALFGLDRPTVGLLNIGVEEIKGLEDVRAAHQLLRDSHLPMDYKGFVEGDDLGRGSVDVVVTEGFAGNIALKTAEGTAQQIAQYLKNAMNRTLLARIGYLLASGAFKALKEKMDPRRSNGGVFLGLNGIVIKSHGGTDAEGFASAVGLGYEMVRNGLLEKIVADLGDYHRERRSPASRGAGSVAS
ncbi:MAG: phosphate acyltransferase PlsX [Hyphomicrobiales bacterium]|nr:phosphate acyltransferase PlsX [Hyphomicrobiales bacterium]